MHVLVQLKSVLQSLVCFGSFFQDTGSQLCFRFFCLVETLKHCFFILENKSNALKPVLEKLAWTCFCLGESLVSVREVGVNSLFGVLHIVVSR